MSKRIKSGLSASQMTLAHRILRSEGIKTGRGDVEKELAKLAHRLRGEGLSRDKIASKFRTSFDFVKWIFAKYPYGPDAAEVSCLCGCGQVFPGKNGRRYYSRKCRARYVDSGGEVEKMPTVDKKTPWRQTYCHQKIDNEYVQCADYLDSCGADCYREENGKGICFKRQKTHDITPSWYRGLFREVA